MATIPSVGSEYHNAYRASFPGTAIQRIVPDSRYPARAAALEDGRVVTDYRPQCSKNIRTGQQFHTKIWMINHAEALMEESRKRQVNGLGSSLPMANTVPPPAAIVHSTPFYSEVTPAYFQHGIGVERANAAAPDLFGTFSYEPSLESLRMNRKNIQTTLRQEGGRNSSRGKSF
jgi:hypothetical protein